MRNRQRAHILRTMAVVFQSAGFDTGLTRSGLTLFIFSQETHLPLFTIIIDREVGPMLRPYAYQPMVHDMYWNIAGSVYRRLR